MQVSFSHQIHWKSTSHNLIEEYCAAIPKLLGKKVKLYQQINSKNVISTSQEKEKSYSKDTALKIVILLSHLTLIVPLAMYIGKAIQRKVASLKITVPLEKVLPDHLETAKEIRRLREDSNYVPKECQNPRHSLRFHFPVDSIFEELCSEEGGYNETTIFGETFKIPKLTFPKLSTELGSKQKQILAEGFNDFLYAHGVEEAKGGIKNLLNMMIEGVIRAPYTGRLQEGNGEYVAGPHGPYYVILDPYFSKASCQRKGLWEEDGVVAFLVPSDENRSILGKGLGKAVKIGYITEEEKKKALKKVITYDEFIALPCLLRKSEFLLKAHLL